MDKSNESIQEVLVSYVNQVVNLQIQLVTLRNENTELRKIIASNSNEMIKSVSPMNELKQNVNR